MKSQRKQSVKRENIQQDKKLKAVVIADAFSKQFRPITLETARVLMPVAGVPIIEYILEFLSISGVTEILLFCSNQAQKVEEYIKKSKWIENHVGVRVEVIIGKNALSFGDALRQIHGLDKIRDDFILVSGDIITNLDISSIYHKHLEVRKKNRDILMTSVFKQHDSKDVLTRGERNLWVAFDPESSRLFHYDYERKDMKLPLSLFNTYPEIQFRSDVTDCFIDICAPEILDIFNEMNVENREKFLIEDILADEVMNRQMNCHILTEEYASRIYNLRSYEVITSDIMKRWVYPIVPDSYFDTRYLHTRENNYFHEDTKMDDTCKIGRNNLIGKGSTISAYTKLNNSIIGKDVTIGKNVEIIDSYIWNNVTIEDNVKIISSIVCDNVKVMSNSQIKKSILSFDVIIGESITVQDSRITCQEELNDFDEEDDSFLLEDIDLGKEGTGKLYILPKRELKGKMNTLGVTKEELIKEDIFLDENYFIEEETSETEEEESLEQEVEARIKSSIQEDHEYTDAKLEIQSLKLSHNGLFSDCAKSILIGMIKLSDKDNDTETVKKFKSILETKKWNELLGYFIKESLEENRESIIESLFQFVQEEEKFQKIFHLFIQFMYTTKVLKDEEIMEWVEEKSSIKNNFMIQKVQDFVQWLRDQEEENDEEEEEEEGEEDSEKSKSEDDAKSEEEEKEEEEEEKDE